MLQTGPFLELIYPFCKSPLRERVAEALGASVDFDQFHEDAIQYFVSRRVFEQLRQEMFGRLQREEESLSTYAQSIKDAATVLRLSLSETEVVAVVMDGLSPSQRSRLVFQKLPVTFRELDQLCIHYHNIRFGDQARCQAVPSDYRTGMNRRTEPPTGDIVAGVSTTSYGQARQKRCFYYNKVGHFRKSCRSRLNALKRTPPVQQTSVMPQ
jgi:hypothetical protein